MILLIWTATLNVYVIGGDSVGLDILMSLDRLPPYDMNQDQLQIYRMLEASLPSWKPVNWVECQGYLKIVRVGL